MKFVADIFGVVAVCTKMKCYIAVMTTEVRTMAAKEPEDEPGLKKYTPPSTEQDLMNSLTRTIGVWPPKMELPSPKEI